MLSKSDWGRSKPWLSKRHRSLPPADCPRVEPFMIDGT
jgi:hypothetical protein